MPPVGATFIWLTTLLDLTCSLPKLMTVGGVMTREGQIGLGGLAQFGSV